MSIGLPFDEDDDFEMPVDDDIIVCEHCGDPLMVQEATTTACLLTVHHKCVVRHEKHCAQCK